MRSPARATLVLSLSFERRSLPGAPPKAMAYGPFGPLQKKATRRLYESVPYRLASSVRRRPRDRGRPIAAPSDRELRRSEPNPDDQLSGRGQIEPRLSPNPDRQGRRQRAGRVQG